MSQVIQRLAPLWPTPPWSEGPHVRLGTGVCRLAKLKRVGGLNWGNWINWKVGRPLIGRFMEFFLRQSIYRYLLVAMMRQIFMGMNALF